MNCTLGGGPVFGGNYSTYILTRKDLTTYIFDRLTRFYGEIFRLRSLADKNGNTIHYDYREPSANLYRISDDAGQFIEVNFGDFQRVKDITDHTGRSVKYTYDSTGRLVSVTDVAGRSTQYQYDSDNRLTVVTDPVGQTVMQAQYNELDKVTSQTDALGRTVNVTYDETARTLTAQDSAGTTEQYMYDADARLIESINALGKSTKYTYGTFRSPETVTDKRGNITKYQYDARGNVTKITTPDNSSVDTAYNPADLPTQITDNRYAPARPTTFTYDAKNNLTKQDMAGVITQAAYDPVGQVQQVSGPSGQTTIYQYNNLGLPTVVTDALGNITRYEYDSLGRVTKQTDPAGVATTFTYDTAGKLLTATDAAGKTSYVYDNLDRLTKVILPDDTTAQYIYNPTNQISKVTDAKGNSTTYTYDTKGNLISRTTATGTAYKTEFDALSRPTKAITPLGKTNQLSYDANGNATQVIDAANKIVNQEFDVLSRLTKSSFSDQTNITRTYDGRGNITAASDPSGQLSLTYDQLDRLIQSKDAFGNTVSYTYDASSRRTSLTYPSGQQVAYAYDAANQLTSVTDWNNQATQLAYHANGLLKEKKLPNGLTIKYDYDSANRLSRLTYVNASGQTQAQTDIERSPVGNITKLNETGSFFTQALGGPTPTPAPSTTPTPPPPAPEPSFIQGHWRLEEDNGLRSDSSGKNNHLTDNNTVLASTDHKEGVKSADLERDNAEYLSIADSAQTGLDGSGGFTLAGYFKRESEGGSHVLIQKYVETGSQRSYSLSLMSDGRLNFTVNGNGITDVAINSAAAFAAGTWYHIAAVFEPSTALKIYVNGILDAENTAGIPASLFNSTAPFHVGAASEGPTSGNAFDGLLDDAYVYNKALTEAEIAQLIQSAGAGTDSTGSPQAGGITAFNYDQLGQLLKASYPDAQTFDYAYDAIGNRIGGTYDADAKLLSTGNVQYAYDDNGAMKTKTDSTATTYHTTNARQELSRVGKEAVPPETWELTYVKQTDSAWNIDIGSYSAPAITDLDSDGKLDLMIGKSDGTVAHYEQTEAKASAAFSLVTAKLNNIDIGSYSTPELVDIDSDSDLDLFIGKSNGEVAYYKNNGSKTSPALALAATKFSNIDIGSYSTPRFADIDNDGDPDLFIGKSDGTLAFYKNTGTSQSSTFQLQSSKFNNWDVGSYSAPVFAQLDSDDDLDLLIGKSDGQMVHYNNAGTKEQPNFQLQAAKFQNIDVGSYSKPFLQDLTGDGLADLLIGESGGKLRLYNASKKVTSLPDPGTTFKYDAFGNRIKKTTGGVETRYVNDISGDLSYVLAELNSSNQPQSLNLYAAGLTSFGPAASSSRLYPLTDPLGNVRFILSSNSTLLTRYAYDPYGNVRSKEGTTNSAFTFASEQFDPETSLTFLRARYYDPSTGTFLARDPVLGPLDIPIEHGEYLYSRNNPVNLSDPSGLDTYKQNRKINGDAVRSNSNPLSHTLIFTTNDGKLEHTYSWGTNSLTEGMWLRDVPSDRVAAAISLKRGVGLDYEGPESLDAYIDEIYSDWRDDPDHIHMNLGGIENCKAEANDLIIEAKGRMAGDPWYERLFKQVINF